MPLLYTYNSRRVAGSITQTSTHGRIGCSVLGPLEGEVRSISVELDLFRCKSCESIRWLGLAFDFVASFFSETHFRKPPWSSRKDARAWGFPIRPLFGWTWVLAFLIVVILPAIDVMTLFFGDPVTKSVLFTATILTFGLPIAFPWKLATLLFKELGISQGLLRGFQLKRRLFDLFEDDVVGPTNNKEMYALLVSAALQQQHQVWPNKTIQW